MYVTVFSTLVTMDYEKFATAYMLTDEGKGVIAALIQGYKEPAIALNCGIMIRECIKQRCLHEYLLDNPDLIKPLFMEYAQSSTFEISSDAFDTIRFLLRRNKQLVSKKMKDDKSLYTQVFTWYTSLISSQEYIICRMSLKVGVESRDDA